MNLKTAVGNEIEATKNRRRQENEIKTFTALLAEERTRFPV